MSIKIIGTEARVHWLSDRVNPNGTLTSDHGMLYITRGDIKLGQVTAESYAGLTPAQAFERRYNSMKSAMGSDFVANDLIVFDKFNGIDFAYDTWARRLINELHSKDRITFSANYADIQIANSNTEALLNYDLDNDIGPLLGAVKQAFDLEHVWDTKDPIVWRWGQEDAIAEVCKKLTNHQLALLAAYTGFGKTKLSVEIATRTLQQGGLVLVTTPITDTKKGFEDNIRNFHFGSDRRLKITYMDSKKFAQRSVADLVKRSKNNELIFVVLTVQDLRYGEQDTGVDLDTVTLRNKYRELSGQVDLWIRDERHAQYEGAVTRERLEGLVARYELDLTATPYSVYNHYRLDHIVSRTLLWGLTNRANTGLPSISIDCINTPIGQVSAKIAGLYSAEEGFDPRKLFVRDGGQFVLEAEIQAIAERMYKLTVSKKKNILSIVNDTELSDKSVGMWVLPNGQDGDSASDYLPALATVLNRSGRVYYVDSYAVEKLCPKNMSIGDYISGLQKQHGRVVVLTCGKFLTGTDIEILGHVVLFDKLNNVANFEQLMGRPIRIYSGKNHVKIYTLQPGAETGLVLGRMARANAQLGGGTEWEVLDCIPLSEYDMSGRCVTLSADAILDQVQDWFRDQLKSRLPTHSLTVALTGCDTTLWSDVNTHQYQKSTPKSKLTDDNGSRVRNRLSDAAQRSGTPLTKAQLTQIQQIEATIQTVMFESQWVAYITDCYNYATVLRSEELELMFGPTVIDAVMDTIAQHSEIAAMIDTYLQNRQQAWANLPPEEVYEEVFQNSDLKQKIGLVFTPFSLANEILDNLPQE